MSVKEGGTHPIALPPRQVRSVVDDDTAQGLPLALAHDARLAVVDAEALIDRDRAYAGDEEAHAHLKRLVARERQIIGVAEVIVAPKPEANAEEATVRVAPAARLEMAR